MQAPALLEAFADLRQDLISSAESVMAGREGDCGSSNPDQQNVRSSSKSPPVECEPPGEGRHTQHASEKRVAANRVTGHLTAVPSSPMEVNMA